MSVMDEARKANMAVYRKYLKTRLQDPWVLCRRLWMNITISFSFALGPNRDMQSLVLL